MRPFISLLAAALIASAPSALAQSTDDLAQIRQQIQQMKQDYEARISELEKRLGLWVGIGAAVLVLGFYIAFRLI